MDIWFWFYVFIGWFLFSFLGVSVCHWINVKKKIMTINDKVWLLMLLTIFLPFVVYVVIVISLYVFLPNDILRKLRMIDEK